MLCEHIGDFFCSSSFSSAIGNKNKEPSNMRGKVSTNYDSPNYDSCKRGKKKKEKCHFSRIAVRLRAVGEQKSKTAI